VRLGQRGDEAGMEHTPDVTGLDRAALDADRLRFGERGMDREMRRETATASFHRCRQRGDGGPGLRPHRPIYR